MAVDTGISEGAGVAVDARRFVVLIEAAELAVAGIVGAEVIVVADAFKAGGTDAGNTGISDGAGIAVIAGETFVSGDQ